MAMAAYRILQRRALQLGWRALPGRACEELPAASIRVAEQATCSTSGRWCQHSVRGFAAEAQGPQTSRLGPVSYLSLALTLGTGGGLVWYYNNLKEKKLAEVRGRQQSVGTPAIGGPFELVDQDGRKFTDEDLKGAWSLLYFGFTHCPDICPEELEKLAAAVDAVEAKAKTRLRPVFISIDPERDTMEKVRAYVRTFHPRLIGLTGPVDKARAAAKVYRVYYTKTTDDPKEYLVDHSIIMYLLDPDGKFVAYYGKNYTAEELAEAIAKAVQGAGR